MERLTPETLARAGRVRLMLLDADGVLTDGRLVLDSVGRESRAFDVRDGLGVRLGRDAGLRFGVVSGRESVVVAARAAELGIDEVHQRVEDKAGRCVEIARRLGLSTDETCFVGDDLIDVPAMRAVGFAAAPADAMPAARAAAHFVTTRAGGRGAVREVIELVLRASGAWDRVTARFGSAD